VTDTDQLAVEDRQGQRQANGDLGTQAGLTGDLDAAAYVLDIAPHHVHADTAPGYIADLLGGGQARMED